MGWDVGKNNVWGDEWDGKTTRTTDGRDGRPTRTMHGAMNGMGRKLGG